MATIEATTIDGFAYDFETFRDALSFADQRKEMLMVRYESDDESFWFSYEPGLPGNNIKLITARKKQASFYMFKLYLVENNTYLGCAVAQTPARAISLLERYLGHRLRISLLTAGTPPTASGVALKKGDKIGDYGDAVYLDDLGARVATKAILRCKIYQLLKAHSAQLAAYGGDAMDFIRELKHTRMAELDGNGV